MLARMAERRPVSHLLYLHGFRSSPASIKARMLADWMQAHRPDLRWYCPQLPVSPRQALALLETLTAGWPADASAMVGSSLGGFYATVLAETATRRDWRVGLINPAVNPARDLAPYVGELPAWHDPNEQLVFEAHHLDELRALAPAALSGRERYLPIIATGDELLDWHEMAARYPGKPLHIVAGSDHALSDFPLHLPLLLQHLSLTPTPP
jgi:uncharacterized protein